MNVKTFINEISHFNFNWFSTYTKPVFEKSLPSSFEQLKEVPSKV